MKKEVISSAFLLSLMLVVLPGCVGVGEVFRAGMWTTIIVIVLVVILVLFIINKFKGRNNP